jgi:hypothetical protein
VGDGQLAIFQGLAQPLQHLALELQQLVEGEDAVVGPTPRTSGGVGTLAHLPGPGMEPPISPASETECWGERNGRVVTRAWLAGTGAERRRGAANGVDLGHL